MTKNGRITLEKYVDQRFDDICKETKEIKDELKEIRTNELEHIRQDIQEIKKFMWKAAGIGAALIFLIQLAAKFVPQILK